MADEFTLADYEATAPKLTRAVIRVWREASAILDMLKFKTENQLTLEGLKFGTLNSATWRNIGEAFTQKKVEPAPWKERVHFMGGKIDIPREYVKANSIIDNRAIQTEAELKGEAFGFNEAFMINTPTADPKAIVGLYYRVQQLPALQSLDAGALDISPDTAATNWQHKFIDLIEDLLDRVDGNPGEKVLMFNRTIAMRAQSAFRQSNLLDTSTDQLGRQFMTYGKGGPRLLDVGYKADQLTKILPDTETAAGTALTGSTKSSIYCARFGEPYLAGFCQEMPNAEDKGELEDGVNVRTIVRFSPGLYQINDRGLARAFNIQAA